MADPESNAEDPKLGGAVVVVATPVPPKPKLGVVTAGRCCTVFDVFFLFNNGLVCHYLLQ